MRRTLIAAGLVLAMSMFGVGVYRAAGYLKAPRAGVQRPSQTTGPALPGTIFVAQAGALYRYQGGRFSQITSESGWMQPAAGPNGTELVAVRRQRNVSDLYLINHYGRVDARLTDNGSASVEGNHWAFYPRFRADGSQLLFDFDPKDPYNSFRVDLAIFASPPADVGSMRQWTYPNQYTGGDVGPVPLRNGGLVYTKFSIDDQGHVASQLWYQPRAGTPGVALTAATADCLQPAVSSDESQIAMVCTDGQTQQPELAVAAFHPASLSLGAATALVKGRLVASPAFSPDGRSIAYLAPAAVGGGFQLWTIPTAQSTPRAPLQITTSSDLDATSAPVWLS